LMDDLLSDIIFKTHTRDRHKDYYFLLINIVKVYIKNLNVINAVSYSLLRRR
jgi:hypothetical protein